MPCFSCATLHALLKGTEVAALRLLAVCSCAFLVSFLSACSGGGSSSSPPEELNVGAGWITIDSTRTYPTEAYLSGSAFISPTWWRCCSGSAEDTGVTVTWTNTTANTSGPAYQRVTYFCFFSCAPDKHTWSATIPIIAGDNRILMTASDPGGNIGRAYITVSPGPPPPDTTAPSVVATSPQDNATGVGVNTAIIAIFSEPMDPASITTSSFILNDSNGAPVPGSVSYSGTTASYTPDTNLAYASQYTALVTDHAHDIAGNPLQSVYTWSFTTGEAPDITPPSVLSVSPVNNEPCADPSGTISATFSEPIDAATATESSFLLRNGAGHAVIGSVWSTGAVIGFNPTLGLAYDTPYTATLTTAVTDLAGNPLSNEFSWGFTTQQSLAGSWQPVTTTGAPLSRSLHTAIWTGAEMIVWGGTGIDGRLDTGGRYKPATDSWQPTSTSGAPSARYYHTAIWTGTEMIVWGGLDQNGAYLDTGARYDPSMDSWHPMSTLGAPSPRRRHTAVWTGSEMIVWGGEDQNGALLNNGARYDPIADRWQPVSALNAPTARSLHTAVWSGSEMIVWGGVPTTTNQGGRYDPLTDTWQTMSGNAAPGGRAAHSAVWTGSEMIVWGGYGAGGYLQSGGIYNHASDSWRSTSLTCAPAGRDGHAAVWSGTQMIIWGGNNLNSGGTYDPSSGTWHATQFLGAPAATYPTRGVWSGSVMLIWGAGALSANPGTGGLFTP